MPVDVAAWCDFLDVPESELEAAATRLHREVLDQQEAFERCARRLRRAPDPDLSAHSIRLSLTVTELVMALGRIRRELHRAVTT